MIFENHKIIKKNEIKNKPLILVRVNARNSVFSSSLFFGINLLILSNVA